MPKAVIKSTSSDRTIRITKDMGTLRGMPCGDTTLVVANINKHMTPTEYVEVVDCLGRRISIPVGEVDNIDGDTDVGTLMKLYGAIKLAANMDDAV